MGLLGWPRQDACLVAYIRGPAAPQATWHVEQARTEHVGPVWCALVQTPRSRTAVDPGTRDYGRLWRRCDFERRHERYRWVRGFVLRHVQTVACAVWHDPRSVDRSHAARVCPRRSYLNRYTHESQPARTLP